MAIRYRDPDTGRFVTYEYAAENPEAVTVVEVKYAHETRQEDRWHEIDHADYDDAYDDYMDEYDYDEGEGS